jgi:cytochrome c1
MPTSSELETFAADSLGVSEVRLEPIQRGANAKVWRVVLSGEPVAALKSYPEAGSGRDRYASEIGALSFLAGAGERQIPRLLRHDPDLRAAMLYWLPGRAGPTQDATEEDLDAALAFIKRMHGYRSNARAGDLPFAAEACLSTGEILRQVDRRRARLSDVAGDNAGLAEVLAHYDEERAASAEVAQSHLRRSGIDPNVDLGRTLQTLSPSDFGFHNAVSDRNGALVFLDFEYFGWDDPVKLALDFELHPGMTLSDSLTIRWQQGVAEIFEAEDTNWSERVAAWRPLLGLRWTLILLNEFLPERWRHRIEAGETRDHDIVLQAQRAKAEAMLSRVSQARRALVTQDVL